MYFMKQLAQECTHSQGPPKIPRNKYFRYLNLLEIAKDTNVRKIINASSSSVYGKIMYLPFDESHPTEPVSPYGITKLMAEHYSRVFEELYGLKSVSLRYFTVYGPRMRPDLAIRIFMQKSLNNKRLSFSVMEQRAGT